jgi:hypothetical protein
MELHVTIEDGRDALLLGLMRWDVGRTGTLRAMEIEMRDFNGAAQYFAGEGLDRWAEIESVTRGLRPQLQASDQRGSVGRPIFVSRGCLPDGPKRLGVQARRSDPRPGVFSDNPGGWH